MPSANGPAEKGAASAKSGNVKNGFVAKATGAAIASGIAWSIYKSFAAGKEGANYVDQSIRSRSPSKVDDFGSNAKERTDEVKSSQIYSGMESKHETEDAGPNVDLKAMLFPKEGKKNANKATGKLQGIRNHEIIGGETLYTISRKYDVSVEALKDVNGLFGDQIVAGETLIVPNK